MKKKITKKDLIEFLVVLIISYLICFPLIKGHYSTDDFEILNRGYKDFGIKNSLIEVRPVTCLFFLVADVINIPIMSLIRISLIIAIAILSMGVVKLKNAILKYTEKSNKKFEYTVLAISYVIIFNFAFLENLQYIECCIMAISVYLSIVVADIIVEKNKKYLLKGGIIALISLLMYQAIFNWIITLTFVLSLIKNKVINKHVVIDTLISIVYVAIGYIFNVTIIKSEERILKFDQNRLGNINNMPVNAKFISQNISSVLSESYGNFPKYLWYIYTAILVIYSFFAKSKDKERAIWDVIGIILISVISVFSIYFITLTSFNAGRLSFSIGAMLGLIILYLYCNTDKNKILNIILYIIAITYIVITMVSYVFVEIEHKKVNELDKNDALIIGQVIKNYENESGTEVTKIVFILKDVPDYKYDKRIVSKSQLCYRALKVGWSRIGIINYYNNRKFIDVKRKLSDLYDEYIDKIDYYNDYFNKCENWDKLNDREFVFEGDTLYLCMY
ncbi:MAG: glucosyltransferase domain-containing protein [Clostridiales bacterium]|nr:glucosyltransferase domain-containing protein [Clostridiales bacterium]